MGTGGAERMILESLTNRKHVPDDRLWEMIKRANSLTEGGYSVWDDNALTLVPLLKRILARAKEVRDLQIYFYVMGKTFWYVRRDGVDDIRFAFQISEMFHQAHAEHLAEETTRFGREFYVDTAARILSFYEKYPQINDEKMKQMLSIFLESDEKYGTDWNAGSYDKIMQYALFEEDLHLAGRAKKKLETLDFTNWCYVCYYVRPMLQYYVFMEEYDRIEELILAVSRKEIAKKYRWCYDQCEQANQETLVEEALEYCMNLGKDKLFRKIFRKWRDLFTHSMEGEIVTCKALLHVFAGDLSRLEETLRVAEEDDRKGKEKKVTPYDGMYWFLWWHFYFRLLDRQGVRTVRIRLPEEASTVRAEKVLENPKSVDGRELSEEAQVAEEPKNATAVETTDLPGNREADDEISADGKRSYSCQALSRYFGDKAEEIGRQMSRARRNFDFKKIKKYHEACLGL